MSGGMCIAIVIASSKFGASTLRKYFTLGGCCGSASEYFSLGGCGSSEMTKASHGQINGSNEVMFGTLLGGTVLFLPVRWRRAETSYRHPR